MYASPYAVAVNVKGYMPIPAALACVKLTSICFVVRLSVAKDGNDDTLQTTLTGLQ